MGKQSSGRPSQAAHKFETPTRNDIAKSIAVGRAGRAKAIHETLATLPTNDFESHAVATRRQYPEKLKPWHHLLMLKLLEGGKTNIQLAAELGKTPVRVHQVVNSPLFQRVYTAILEKRYESIAEGEHGVVAQARLEAPNAMVRLVALSKTAKSEGVKKDSIIHILALAGAAPVVRTETYSLDKLLEQMDRRELETFVDHGKVPRRFAEMLAQQGRDLPFSDESEAIDVTPVDNPPPDDENGDA